PLIKWVLQEENYVEDMMSVFNKFINTSKKFYFSLVSLTQILAYFLLFPSIPTMYQLTDVFFNDRNVDMREYKTGTPLLRIFSLYFKRINLFIYCSRVWYSSSRHVNCCVIYGFRRTSSGC